jgi:hypothetical protein
MALTKIMIMLPPTRRLRPERTSDLTSKSAGSPRSCSSNASFSADGGRRGCCLGPQGLPRTVCSSQQRRDRRDDRRPHIEILCIPRGLVGSLRHGGRTTKVLSRRVFLPWTGGATRLKVNTERHEPVRSPGPSLKYRSVPGRGPGRPNSHKGNWLDRHAAGITNEFLPEDSARG